MPGLVEDTERSRKFKDVTQLNCQDRKRYMECEVSQEADGDKFEGSFTAQDVVIEDSDVEKFSTSADKLQANFSGKGECKLFKENGILRCKRK